MLVVLKQRKSLQCLLLLVIFMLLYRFVPQSETNWLWRLPSLLKELPIIINDAVNYLMFEWLPIDVYDPDIEEYEQKPLFGQITRGFSGAILFMIELIREILLGGVKTIVAFTSWDWVSENEWARWPALPWTVITGGMVILGYVLGRAKLALFILCAFTYIAVFGQWEPSMKTLSFVLIAAPIAILLGLWLGVWAYKSKTVETIMNPLLNVAQIMPHFAYLIPVMVFFGIGDHAGAIATVIFATPPMVRLTVLGLKKVPPEVAEAGLMTGCTDRQLLYRVLIPSARRDILIGVNQVIMQCLAMVVIASLIGAKGLGNDLLIALNQLRIGKALEIGVCIVLIALVLDRLSLAWANKQTDYFADLSFKQKHKYSLMFLVVFVVGIILAVLGSFIFKEGFNYLYLIPQNKGITTEAFWQWGVDWIWETFFYSFKAFNVWFIVDVLVPIKTAFLGMPVIATFTLMMGIGFIVGGIRSALIVGGFLLFIALTEWWDRALITSYLIVIAVLISGTIGITVGTLAAQHPVSSRFMLTMCDTFQTFPSFIYLIPVMMLFGVTDTSVLIAIVVYATIPAARYTIEGLRSVPQELHDAAAMSGTNRFQKWLSVELPLSFPHMALGINQTVVFALSMVIIGALIGTDDLGQLILKSLSDKAGVGNGLVLGLCVAFIGLAFDQILRTWADQRKHALGLS
ncbi:ABC transporter permease [Leucothrix arctica]|uniref:Glycine/betaine ABC transporter n=1 Tax=Leucothrix arctica TaxID=1481894 RepID=A0A317CL34_9GAMM|nr:ABC transporter permease subunit [Leucothrix arctica]PWQ98133.1 glycine/betaine ABC transporter [Leucothrix arctica]